MKNPYWPEIFSCFSEIEQHKISTLGKRATPDGLLNLRNVMVISINQLQEILAQSLDEQTIHVMIFALVAFLDEEIQLSLSKENRTLDWLSLQQNFYNTSNAGELFYKYLDDILDNPIAPPILIEFYYFILNKGFRGKYVKSTNKLSKYMDFLIEKIPTSSLPTKKETFYEKEIEIKINFKPWHYYAFASCLIFLFYSIFYFKSLII